MSNLARGALFAHFSSDTGNRSTGTGADNDHVDFTTAGIQNFLRGLIVVGQRVADVAILKNLHARLMLTAIFSYNADYRKELNAPI